MAKAKSSPFSAAEYLDNEKVIAYKALTPGAKPRYANAPELDQPIQIADLRECGSRKYSRPVTRSYGAGGHRVAACYRVDPPGSEYLDGARKACIAHAPLRTKEP
jgi:hypothetical protein